MLHYKHLESDSDSLGCIIIEGFDSVELCAAKTVGGVACNREGA